MCLFNLFWEKSLNHRIQTFNNLKTLFSASVNKEDNEDATVTEQLFPPGKVSDLQQRLGRQNCEPMIGEIGYGFNEFITTPSNFKVTNQTIAILCMVESHIVPHFF